MFHHILVPLTGSAIDENVVPHVIAMAQLGGSRVRLVHVLEKLRAAGIDRPVDPIEWHVRKLEAEAYLDRAAARFRDAGVETEVMLLEGQAAEHLINCARRSSSDLIVMATAAARRGSVGTVVGQVLWRSYVSALVVRAPSAAARQRAGDWIAGAAEVGGGVFGQSLLDAPGPSLTDRQSPGMLGRVPPPPHRLGPDAADVATAANGAAAAAGNEAGGAVGGAPSLSAGAREARREGGRADAGRLAAVPAPPTDGMVVPPGSSLGGGFVEAPARTPGVRYRRVLVALDCSKRAECVLPLVRLLAAQHEARVLLAHVVVGPALPRLTPPTEEDLDLARRLTERNLEEAEKYLQDVRARLAVEADIHLLRGRSVATELHDLVERENVDLVVCSAHGYTGESRWPYGDVATNFIGYCTTPLMLVQDMQPRPDQPMPEDVTTEHWGH